MNSIVEGLVMGRRCDIEDAWRSAIVHEPNGRRTVTTERFVEKLKKVNWNMSLHEANRWIKAHVNTYRDVSTQEGENKTYQRFNPDGGL